MKCDIYLDKNKNFINMPQSNLRMFFLFNSPQDLLAPSADHHETLTRDHYLVALYNASPKIWGAVPLKIFWPKTCNIWCNFTQLLTLIENISGTKQHVQNWKDM